MKLHSKDDQLHISPEQALEILKKGNERFQHNIRKRRNLLEQVNETSHGQFPFATILSCIDSRTSSELIFDQGLGDIFCIRIAGNVVNDDVLGCMEFATHIAGSRLVVVLGHTHCGAVNGACNKIHFGHLTKLLNKIQPAIEMETETTENRTASNHSFVYNVTMNHVKLVVEEIRHRSKALSELEHKGQIKIIGAMYDIEHGIVNFLE